MISKKLLLLGLGLVLISITLLILSLVFDQDNQSTEPLTPTPSTQNPNALNIVSFTPKENPSDATGYPFSQKVTITFDKNVIPDSITITTEPALELRKQAGTSPNTLIVSPNPPKFWKPDVIYTITVHEGSTSVDGNILLQNVNHRIKSTIQEGGV